MSKTPEEMAYDYGEKFNGVEISKNDINIAWYDGYKAAQEHAHAALEEAEAKIDKLQTKLSDAGILTTDHILDATKMVDVNGWISVHNRLPDHEREVFITDGLTVSAARYYKYGGWGVTLGRGNKYWMEKPELPEER